MPGRAWRQTMQAGHGRQASPGRSDGRRRRTIRRRVVLRSLAGPRHHTTRASYLRVIDGVGREAEPLRGLDARDGLANHPIRWWVRRFYFGAGGRRDHRHAGENRLPRSQRQGKGRPSQLRPWKAGGISLGWKFRQAGIVDATKLEELPEQRRGRQ